MQEATENFKGGRFSRQKLARAYADMANKTGQEYLASTKPMHSTQSLRATVVNADTTVGYGYLKFAKNQQMLFFEPAIGQSGQLGADLNHRWSEADTNLTKGRSTPGAADMAVEGVGMRVRNIMAVYGAADLADFYAAAQTPDDALTRATTGLGVIVDPGSHVLPVEVSSPAMLEEVLWTALSPFITLSFEWDQAERTEKIGTADQLTVGGGATLLRANGLPSPRDRYEQPEGYIWTRDGQPGCEFICRATLAEDVLVPFACIAPPAASTTFDAPTEIHAVFTMRLFGVQFRLPNKN
jgi:hypothetical protein